MDDVSVKYTLGEILGEGGTGIIYLATDEQGQKVVIKQFKNSVLDIRSTGWKREMETLKSLHHPQIPKYIDYFIQVTVLGYKDLILNRFLELGCCESKIVA